MEEELFLKAIEQVAKSKTVIETGFKQFDHLVKLHEAGRDKTINELKVITEKVEEYLLSLNK